MKILNKIQKELNVPKLQRNTFGNYNYRSCEDILEAVKPLLGEAILTISDEILMIGDRFYVKATANLKEGENEISVSAYARESFEKKGMDSAQITGSASSYARKYALNGLFCIDDTKDSDTTNTNESTKKTTKAVPEELKKKIKDTTALESLKAIWDTHKGLGAEFANLVTAQKKFIMDVQKQEQNG